MGRVVPNLSGIRELMRSDTVRDALTPRADRVLAAAESGAPVDTGAYQASLRTEDVTTEAGAGVRITADVPYAVFVEADTGNLSRALDAAG